MANSGDPDQLASSEANWSGSTWFANAGYIQDEQDNGLQSKLLLFVCTTVEPQWLEHLWFLEICARYG